MQKMDFGQKTFHEIDLFDFTVFFALDSLIFWPTVKIKTTFYVNSK